RRKIECSPPPAPARALPPALGPPVEGAFCFGCGSAGQILRRLLLLLIWALVASTANAQVPGQNVNMVTGTKFPGGDPYLQKQNEPSGAVSTVNPCRLLVGANDYRAVNLPGLPADKENGDAWVGWYTSINCGQTWYSTLLPGYPQDTSAAGKSSPVYGLTTAADPNID